MSFREKNKIPVRRPIVKVVTHYSQHRDDLVFDFKARCGYCNSIHSYRNNSYEIDHFIPRIRNKKPFLTIKSETDYSNLVYACKSCNNAKRNKWATNDETVAIENDKGFVDPCDLVYDSQFERLNTGEIKPLTNLGSWMYKELKLYKPQHEIIYQIEQLDLIIDELEPNLGLIDNVEIYKKITGLLLKYRNYIKKLGNT